MLLVKLVSTCMDICAVGFGEEARVLEFVLMSSYETFILKTSSLCLNVVLFLSLAIPLQIACFLFSFLYLPSGNQSNTVGPKGP